MHPLQQTVRYIKGSDKVLIIWQNNNPNDIADFVAALRCVTEVSTDLEHAELICVVPRRPSSYDIVLSNLLTPYSVYHSDRLLAVLLKLLKPNGKLVLREAIDRGTDLRLNGYVNIIKEDEFYIALKPDFEVGSKQPLKKKPLIPWQLNDPVEAAWKDNKDEELIDEDLLLDENDLKVPDKESLRVCATTGKRKACADCSCGLAEELDGLAEGLGDLAEGLGGEGTQAAKSACGSCYLGDAFRCASCPYLGMPAFKPGEKVKLDLADDI